MTDAITPAEQSDPVERLRGALPISPLAPVAEDVISALERIEMLTATGDGLDPQTTMEVHLLAGIGRATHDPYAWYATASPPSTASTDNTKLVEADAAAIRAAGRAEGMRAAMEADGTAYLAEEVIRLFGDHTTALGLLMHLSLLAKDMPKGEIRDGITLATEEGAAWLGRQDGDGRDTMQTLMEHVTGLLNGAYALVDVGAPIQTLDHPAAPLTGEGE